jgi:hypothetical protein
MLTRAAGKERQGPGRKRGACYGLHPRGADSIFLKRSISWTALEVSCTRRPDPGADSIPGLERSQSAVPIKMKFPREARMEPEFHTHVEFPSAPEYPRD